MKHIRRHRLLCFQKEKPIMKNKYIAIIVTLVFFGCGEYEKPAQETKSLEEPLTLSRENGKYKVEASVASFDVIDEQRKSLVSDGFLIPAPTKAYRIFPARIKNEAVYLGERNLNVAGVPNLRDVGGLFTQDGYQIKWGKVFRSGKLAEVEEEEFSRLRELNLRTIIDFRSQVEKDEDPDRWPDIETINTIELPIGDEEDRSMKDMLAEINSDGFDADQFMYEANKNFVLRSSSVYKSFFKVLLDASNYPLLFHCSAGKDRAGFGSFLVLSALGVATDTKLNEYLLSNFYLQNSSEQDIKKAAKLFGIDQDKLRKLMKVKPEYIQGAFDAIKENYGSVSAFLCEELEVCEQEREQLKQQLLYGYKATYTTLRDTLGVELPSNTDAYQVDYLLEGAQNFRTFNVPQSENLAFIPNKIFRSEALHEITNSDVKKLEDIGVKTIIDFRYEEEVAQDPDRKPGTVTSYLNPKISRSKSSLQYKIDSATYMQVRAWFIDGSYEKVDSTLKVLDIDPDFSRYERYREFALDYTTSYRTFMKALADPANYPIVYHCQGGKDRAGFASAVLLKTLGFDDQAIVDDFLTTNLHNHDEIKSYYATGVKSLNATIGAHSGHLMGGLRAVEKEYGSFQNYLTEGLGLTEADIQSIKTNLLVSKN